VKRLILIALACVAVGAILPARAEAARPCGYGSARTLWIDYADTSVPFWPEFGRKGVIAATSNFISPPQLRARGAKTVYWDLTLAKRVGTPTEPADPSTIDDRAQRIYDYAVSSTGCTHPIVAENELFGAWEPTPWVRGTARYRADVLAYLRELRARGARPMLLVSSSPYTDGDAGDWWRQVAQVSDIVREVYFGAPRIYEQGPILGNRSIRAAYRGAVDELTSIGVPPGRIGLMMGFDTNPGWGGREGLKPASAWFDVVKWQALAAKEIASERHISTVWSWGWAHWALVPGSQDPDKARAACVYLWTRNPHLCNGPKAAGPGFDTSRTEGQLFFPQGVRCLVAGERLGSGGLSRLGTLTSDPEVAFATLFARVATALVVPLSGERIVRAERAVVDERFGGSRTAYNAALARAHARPETARGVIADELRRAVIESRLRVATPSNAQVADFYDSYAEASARLVQVSKPVAWLGHKKRGYAIDGAAPPLALALPANRWSVVHTMTGTYRVRPLAPAVPLAALPAAAARPSIVAALISEARADAYAKWLLGAQKDALAQTLCRRDRLPSVDPVALTDYLPFLELDSALG
jgi:hypothetical protein